jgi:hypothetical protein
MQNTILIVLVHFFGGKKNVSTVKRFDDKKFEAKFIHTSPNKSRKRENRLMPLSNSLIANKNEKIFLRSLVSLFFSLSAPMPTATTIVLIAAIRYQIIPIRIKWTKKTSHIIA